MIRGDRAGYAQLSGCGLNLFTDDELAELHRATLDVLADTGLMVLNDEALEIYYSHGCNIDKEKKIVKIPPYIVEEAIRSAPSSVLLAGRDPQNDLILEGNRVGFSSFGVAIKVLDLETGAVRESTNKDLAESTILVDAADNVDMLFQPMTPRDVPPEAADLITAETCLSNSTKHFHNGDILSAKSARRYFEMGAAIAGSAEEMRRRPVCSIVFAPVSPLQYSTDICEVIIESARLGIPIDIVGEPLSGATAPVTLAGSLIVRNAEVLGGLVLSQLTKKGSPVIYGSSVQTFDLRAVNALVGDPELGMMNAAVAKQAQYYNLPSLVAGT